MFKKISVILAIPVILLAISACKKPTEGVDLIYNTKFAEATASFQFIDAVTGEQIGFDNSSPQVTIVVEGPSKSLIKSNIGSSTLKVSKGFITLASENGVVPSASNVLKFHVVASAAGYLSNSVAVEMSGPGTQHFVVKLVNISNTPEGVSSIIDNSISTNSSGLTQAATSISTPAVVTSFENTKARVEIPAGTKLMDENMNPVTGTITTSLVYFNNQDESSLNNFPGGFVFNSPDVPGGTSVFKTGGYIAMEMVNGGGKEVKNFGSSIQMTVEIPTGTTNENGVEISDGMVMPIWSYDPETGEWAQESLPNISFNNTSGKYEVTFDMIHLSYWNLDWHYPGSCSLGAKINISSNVTSNTYGYFVLRYPNGNFFRGGSLNVKNGEFLQFFNAPGNTPFTISIYRDYWAYYSGQTAQSLSIPNLCSGSYTYNYVGPTPTNVTVNINARCANRPNQIIRPTLTVYARPAVGGNWIYVGEMVNGHITTNALQLGTSYIVGVIIGGSFYQAPDTYTVNSLEYSFDQVLDPTICSYIN